jgi:hypothetical protein
MLPDIFDNSSRDLNGSLKKVYKNKYDRLPSENGISITNSNADMIGRDSHLTSMKERQIQTNNLED